MTKPTVFISYSHKDEDWKDRMVSHLKVLQMEDILDVWEDRRIETGEDWYPEIQKAMDQASVAILMVTVNFLTSKFILGEEVPRLMKRRAEEGLRIFPVIVKPCAWKQVEWLARMQTRPQKSKTLSAGDEHQIDADLAAIAEEVATVINQPCKSLTRFKGPGYVEFVVVAGRESELIEVRTNVNAYGDECVDWRPYYPDFDKRVGPFVQNVASSEDFTSHCIHPASDLCEKLEQAKEKNNIVVVIVDAWTIRLQSYHDLMHEYDKTSFFNCAVLIPWNNQDDETEQKRDTLETALRITFENKTAAKDPKSFREEIVSFEQLDNELRDALIEIRRKILETGEVFRKAVGEAIIVQPQISGPGES